MKPWPHVAVLPDNSPASLPQMRQQVADLAAREAGIECRAYIAGWRYGLLCGLVCGACTTGLGLLLWQTISAALGCTTC